MSGNIKLKDVDTNFLNIFQSTYRRPSVLDRSNEKAYFVDFLSSKATNIEGLSIYKVSDLSTSYEIFSSYWNKKTSLSINDQVEASLITIDDQYVASYYFFMLLYVLKGYYQARKLDLNLKMIYAFEDFSKSIPDIFTSEMLIGNLISVLLNSLDDPNFQYYEVEWLKNDLYKTLYDYHVKRSIEEPSSMPIYFKDALKQLGIDKITSLPYANVKQTLLDVQKRDYDSKTYLLLDNSLKSIWFFNRIDEIMSMGGAFSYKGFVFKIVPLTMEEYKKVQDTMLLNSDSSIGGYIELLIDMFTRRISEEKMLKAIASVSTVLLVGGLAYFVFRKRNKVDN